MNNEDEKKVRMIIDDKIGKQYEEIIGRLNVISVNQIRIEDITRETREYGKITNEGNTNTWYHIVATWSASVNGGVPILYKNGELVNISAYQAFTGSLSTVSSPLIIGDDTDLYYNFKNWYGYIDQVAIWSRALSVSDVLTLYNSGNGLAFINW